MNRRLYRSRSDRAIAGIAGGMGEYLDVDPTVIRIAWVLAAILSGGLALLAYIVLAFVIPQNPYASAPAGAGWGPGAAPTWAPPAAPGSPAWNPDWSSREARRAARAERPGRAGLIIGTVLIVFGVIALADVALPRWVAGAYTGPAILVALGAALLVASLRRRDEPAQVTAPSGIDGATTGGTPTGGAVDPAPAVEAATYDADVTTTYHAPADPA